LENQEINAWIALKVRLTNLTNSETTEWVEACLIDRKVRRQLSHYRKATPAKE